MVCVLLGARSVTQCGTMCPGVSPFSYFLWTLCDLPFTHSDARTLSTIRAYRPSISGDTVCSYMMHDMINIMVLEKDEGRGSGRE